jgi:hypothetical protein
LLDFEGDSYRLSASAQVAVLTRYESNMDLRIPSEIMYGDALSVLVTLSGPTSKIQGAQVLLIVSLGGIEERQVSALTDLAGRATLSIEGLGAGNHTVLVAYEGSPTYNICTKTVSLAVLPVVSVRVTGTSDVVLGLSCTLTVEYQVAGAGPDWTGTLSIIALGPDDNLVDQWTFGVVMNGSQLITFLPEREGFYHLNITLLGLPVLGAESKTFTFSVRESYPIQLDESTVPVVSEIGVVAGVALFLSRRLKRMESQLPGEWES